MKRQQAKLFIDKEFTAEQIREFEPDFNPENMYLIKAFAEGAHVFYSDGSRIRDDCSFLFSSSEYKIIRPKMLINGIECEPFDSVEPKRRQDYWVLDGTERDGVYSYSWYDTPEDRRSLRNGIYTNKDHALHTAVALFGIKQ